jgi:hypothetical protein
MKILSYSKSPQLKTKKILAFLTIALAVIIAACKKDDFVEVVGVCPVVVSTNPINAAIGVPLEKIITITFNEEMNPSTINQKSITLQGITPITGTVSYSGNVATFTPSGLLATNTTYTGRVTTAVKDLKGNALQSDYVWTFSTGATLSPVVIVTDPANNATAVVLNKNVTTTFSVPMDPLTITGTTFTIQQGTTAVAGTVTYSGSTATFTPSALLAANTVYTGTITTAAKNTAGTPLVNNYVWSFTTGALSGPTVIATDPLNNATGVVLNKKVNATFSVPMDALSITGSTFTILQGTTPVAGTISYTGSTATFTPTAAFASNTIYTATITTGAKNAAGIPLANNYMWTFTTGLITAPMVLSTDPANNATSVVLNKIITATFSVPMDALSITGSTFTINQGTNTVAGTVTYSGSTATFTPTANLLSGLTYTGTITTGAKNVAGTELLNNYVWTFSTAPTLGGPFVDLKSVGRFGIIAGVGVSNNAGPSEIRNQDVGISPGVRSSITGFPPAIIIGGAMYASDDIAPPGVPAMLIQAKQDLTDAYLFAEAAVSPAPATVAGDLGGQTLAPGIYKSTSTLMVQSGDLTLDAKGDLNAVWIFQVAAAFTTVGGAGGNIILSGGAQAKNIFWQTGSSATIGDYTSFQGTVLALTSITMNSHAIATGRMLARNGSVVMTSTNIINKP